MDPIDTDGANAWAKGLLPEQRAAASYNDANARLLAGPGTGKTRTLTARIEFLILDQKVKPEGVIALTFTRAAAGELAGRVEKVLEGKVVGRPRIMTLHAFSLRTLLHNAGRLKRLPMPLRIVDDWEQRNIVEEDLKAITDTSVRTVRDQLNALSADWDTLRADDELPNPLKADPRFVGAWQEHRAMYAYTLRAELVYQFKRALEQDDLDLGASLEHLLVDEYQDLNACDLSVVSQLVARGTQLYAAGDDDQSIYGFRHANPEGIRRFDRDHPPSTDLPLATCMRCDRAIMELARFVADLDPRRIKKQWNARADAGDGQVKLLKFANGAEEASAIASMCKLLVSDLAYQPDEILVLIRSDKNGAFSKPLAEQMALAAVPFHINVGTDSPLDSPSGRVVLSLLRLASFEEDSLAWRTLLSVRKNSVGRVTIGQIEDVARQTSRTFASALASYATDASSSPALRAEYATLTGLLTQVKAVVGDTETVLRAEEIDAALHAISSLLTDMPREELDAAFAHLVGEVKRGDVDSFDRLLGMISMAGITPDQEVTPGAVNLLTMHKAKGLSARAVIVMACEDEYLPGRQQAVDDEADERRLLYVSLTRARERLFISYATHRDGQQQHTGRDSGKKKRSLTRYLRNAPLHPTDGATFLRSLAS